MNWKSIIATAIVTGLVTMVSGMLLFWWQSEKTELIYNSIKSIPFDDTSNKLFIQQIEIKNTGDKPVEDVVLLLSFSDEKIEKSKISIDQAISHSKEVKDNFIKLSIDNLNPDEGANVSILYQSSNNYSPGASISLRAKGVKGRSIGAAYKKALDLSYIGIALLGAYAGLLSVFISTQKGRERLQFLLKSLFIDRNLSLGEQKYIIASLLSAYGYPEKAKEYLESGVARQYWVEADLLTAEAIKGDSDLKHNTIKILKYISEIPYITSSSQGIVFYNIARIYKALGNQEKEVEVMLASAKKLNKKQIEDRLIYDPIFGDCS